MKGKTTIILMLLILISSVQALTISDYNVQPYIPLNKTLTIEGKLDQNLSNVRCAIKIYDVDGKLIDRLTDEYTTSGYFGSAWYQINEPKFIRDGNYIATTNCEGAEASSPFQVNQKEGIAKFIEQESLFYTGQGNLTSFSFFILILLILGVLIFAVLFAYKSGKGLGGF